jgi:hypothetical protein
MAYVTQNTASMVEELEGKKSFGHLDLDRRTVFG